MKKSLKNLTGILSSVLITLFGLMVITFMIGRVMPVDPVIAAVGDNAPEAVIQRVRAEMGLDQPLVVQFVHYVGQVLHGDFGNSILTRNPVTQDIARYFPATLELATAALLVAALVGIPLGVWAAVRQGSVIDQTIRVICLAGHSVPVFMLALISLLVFYATLDIAPGPGRQDIIYEGMIPTLPVCSRSTVSLRGLGCVLGRGLPYGAAGPDPRIFQYGVYHAYDPRLYA